jgi:flagellar biosynthesis/type III secretory pathway M-ring protein FliF/YscJ
VDVIKAQLARIQQQLGALTVSQRMLAAALVTIMVLTLAMWGRYAGTAEMEPVLEQALKPEELTRITGELRSKGIDYKVVGDKVLVTVDRKIEALANLSYAQVVPQDTRGSYDEILKRISPWDSAANTEATRIDAKNAYLAQVIRKFPGVATADVIIDPSNEVRIGGNGKQPKAAVYISTRDGTNASKKLVRAAAATVAGAQSGLNMSRVTVVINGVNHRVPDTDDAGGFGGADDLLMAQQQAGKVYAEMVREQLAFMGAVLVSVTVDIDIQSQTKSEEIYDPTKVASKEQIIESENTEETTSQPSGGEPGAITNTGISIVPQPGAGTAGGTSSTRERSTQKMDNRFSKSNIQTNTPAGKLHVLRAAVRVPRSYLVQLYRQGRKTAPGSAAAAVPSAGNDEPDDEALKPVLLVEAKRIRDDVRGCTGIQNESDIAVEPYPDVLPTMLAAATTSKVQDNVTGILMGHYKEVGAAVLALVSLFMLSSVVKKGSPAPAVAGPMELKEAPVLVTEEDIAGEAGERSPTLDGMELDEDAIKAQTMLEQVTTMVKENPDSAAQLVKRWLNRP